MEFSGKSDKIATTQVPPKTVSSQPTRTPVPSTTSETTPTPTTTQTGIFQNIVGMISSLTGSYTDSSDLPSWRAPIEQLKGTKVSEDQLLIWDAANCQHSNIMLNGTLIAIPRWLSTYRQTTLLPANWEFSPSLSKETRAEMKAHMEYETLVDRMLPDGDLPTFGESFWVKASDDPADIRQGTMDWPCPITTEVEQQANQQNGLLTATRLKLNKKAWDEYGIHCVSGRVGPDGCYKNDRECLKMTAGKNVKFAMDDLGHTCMSWTLDNTKVRITDLTTGVGGPQPSFDQIRTRHASPQHKWTPLNHQFGRFWSFKTNFNNSLMRPILEGCNQDHVIVGTMAAGFCQVNSWTALNLDASSITLSATRCCPPRPVPEGYEFFRVVDKKVKFSLLVEIMVCGMPVISFIATDTDMKQSSAYN